MARYVGCTHPECNHIGLLITKVHCRTAHGMEREELFEKYGKPEFVMFDSKRHSQNMRMENTIQGAIHGGNLSKRKWR